MAKQRKGRKSQPARKQKHSKKTARYDKKNSKPQRPANPLAHRAPQQRHNSIKGIAWLENKNIIKIIWPWLKNQQTVTISHFPRTPNRTAVAREHVRSLLAENQTNCKNRSVTIKKKQFLTISRFSGTRRHGSSTRAYKWPAGRK